MKTVGYLLFFGAIVLVALVANGCAVNAGRDFGVTPDLNLEVSHDLGK